MKFTKKQKNIIIGFSLIVLVSIPAYIIYKTYYVDLEDLTLNTEPQLNVGQIYVYRSNNYSTGFLQGFEHDTWRIKGIETISDRTYFKVDRNYLIYEILSNQTVNLLAEINETWYFETITGACISKSEDLLGYVNRDFAISDLGFFSSWMLSLKDNLKFKITIDDNYVYKFEVLNQVELHGIECFEVKVKKYHQKDLYLVQYFYIDMEKRINIEESIPESDFLKALISHG